MLFLNNPNYYSPKDDAQLTHTLTNAAMNGSKADKAMVTLEELLNIKNDQREIVLRTLTLETLNDFLQRASYVSEGNEHAGPDLWKAHWHGTLDPLIQQIRQTMDVIVNRFLVLPIEKRRAVLDAQPLGTLRAFKAILEKRKERQIETEELVNGFIPEIEEASLDRVSRMKPEPERDAYLRVLSRATLAALQRQGKEVIQARYDPGNNLIHERLTGRLKPLLDKIDMLIAKKPEIEFSFNGVTQVIGQRWFDLAAEFIKVNDSNKELITILYRIFSGIVQEEVRTPEMVRTIKDENMKGKWPDIRLLMEKLFKFYDGANSRIVRFKEALPFKSGADFNQMERSANALISETRDSILSLEENFVNKENLNGEVKELAVLRKKLSFNSAEMRKVKLAQEVTKRTINTFLQKIKPYDPYYMVVRVSISDSNRDILDQKGWNLYLYIRSKPSLGGLVDMFRRVWSTLPNHLTLDKEFKSLLKEEYEKEGVEYSDAAMTVEQLTKDGGIVAWWLEELKSHGMNTVALEDFLSSPTEGTWRKFYDSVPIPKSIEEDSLFKPADAYAFIRYVTQAVHFEPKEKSWGVDRAQVTQVANAQKADAAMHSSLKVGVAILIALSIIYSLWKTKPAVNSGPKVTFKNNIPDTKKTFPVADVIKVLQWLDLSGKESGVWLPNKRRFAKDILMNLIADIPQSSKFALEVTKFGWSFEGDPEAFDQWRRGKIEELQKKLQLPRDSARAVDTAMTAEKITWKKGDKVVISSDTEQWTLIRSLRGVSIEGYRGGERQKKSALWRSTAIGKEIYGSNKRKVRIKINEDGINFDGPQDWLTVQITRSQEDAAITAADKAQIGNGGIDLNANNINWNIRKDGNGVEMNIDPAMIERIRREGIDSLSPVIFRITPVTNIWQLVGA